MCFIMTNLGKMRLFCFYVNSSKRLALNKMLNNKIQIRLITAHLKYFIKFKPI